MGTGGRERPTQETENTRFGKPRTPGTGNREHPVWKAENTRHRKPRTPSQGSRELPALVRALRTPGARTRVPFGRRGALFIPAIREVFSPPFDNSEPAAPRTCTPKRVKREIESEETEKERDRARIGVDRVANGCSETRQERDRDRARIGTGRAASRERWKERDRTGIRAMFT